MIHFGWAIATFFIGGTIGFFVSALCNMVAQNDKEDEERRLRESDCFSRP